MIFYTFVGRSISGTKEFWTSINRSQFLCYCKGRVDTVRVKRVFFTQVKKCQENLENKVKEEIFE